MTNIDSIKNKIALLLAKAEGTDNVYEQEAFMAKVNELLERHQIEMHEIRKAGADKDPMATFRGTMTRSHEWPSYVANQLATLYGCKIVRGYTPDGKKAQYTWTLVGRESACVTFDLMFPFVQSQVRQQARTFAKEMGVTPAKAERAVGMALSSRIYKMTLKAQERRDELASKALVPVDDVEAYYNEVFADAKLKKSRGTKQGYDGRAREYADKVSLNAQATAAGHKQITG